MSDAADKVVDDDARAMDAFEQQLALRRRIEESMRSYDPTRSVDCLDCGVVIQADRLKAAPHTRRCTACAQLVEQRLFSRGP